MIIVVWTSCFIHWRTRFRFFVHPSCGYYRIKESRCILGGILPNFPTRAARRSHWLCWKLNFCYGMVRSSYATLFVVFQGKFQLSLLFSWYTPKTRVYTEKTQVTHRTFHFITLKVLTIGSLRECAYWKGGFIKDGVLVSFSKHNHWIYSRVINVILAMGNLLALITKRLLNGQRLIYRFRPA